MKQITFKEQVTIEQLEQRAKDGECVALVGSGGKCIWYINELWHCTCDLEIQCLDVFEEDWLEYAKSWIDTKTQLTVATGDVINFSKLEPGDVVEWHDDRCRGRGIVDEVNQLWFDVHDWDKIFDDNTSATVYKRDLPPLHQPKKGVLRYKTLYELERTEQYKRFGTLPINGDYHTNLTLRNVAGKPVSESPLKYYSWMTTTDPLH